jgi:hypothetical protein
MHGPACIVWANLTPFSIKYADLKEEDAPLMATVEMAVPPHGGALGMVQGGRGLYCNMPNGWAEDQDYQDAVERQAGTGAQDRASSNPFWGWPACG